MAVSSREMGSTPKRTSLASPVTTARTPGTARAAVTSIDLMSAWGCVERRILPTSMCGSLRSSVYWASPVTLGRPSM